MKKYLLILPVVFLASLLRAQNGLGFNLGYATSKAPMASIVYFVDDNAFSLGLSYQLNDALGKKLTNTTTDVVIGNGDFFFIGSAGYTRIISDKVALEGELSFGQRSYYTNYTNNNYSAGGYHRILKTKAIFGGGASIVYSINDIVGVFAGYNSISELGFGVQFRFLQ